jgi:hypothetical protein
MTSPCYRVTTITCTVASLLLLMVPMGHSAKTKTSPTKSMVGETLNLDITAIVATKGKPYFDKELSPLAGELTRSFPKHRHFKFKERFRLSVKKAASAARRLQSGKSVIVTYLGHDKRFVRVQLSFDGAQSIMKVRNGSLFFYARKGKQKKLLILAMRPTIQK